MKLDEGARGMVERGRKVEDLGRLRGRFDVEIMHKDGSVEKVAVENTIANVGKNKMLDVMFHADTQVATWYVGLVDNLGWTAFAATDTMGAHAGWAEATQYNEATRPAWPEDAAASQSITNTVVAQFTMNATKTIKGIFLTSDSAKSGTAGTLWCGTAFSSTVSVVSGDVIKVTYTVTLT